MRMYVVAILRHRVPTEVLLTKVDEHRAYLRMLKERGILLASGPCEPRFAGVLLLRVPDEYKARELDALRDGDPFVTEGFAQYEFLHWAPTFGKEELDHM